MAKLKHSIGDLIFPSKILWYLPNQSFESIVLIALVHKSWTLDSSTWLHKGWEIMRWTSESKTHWTEKCWNKVSQKNQIERALKEKVKLPSWHSPLAAQNLHIEGDNMKAVSFFWRTFAVFTFPLIRIQESKLTFFGHLFSK